jgi:chromosome segregation ATPase
MENRQQMLDENQARLRELRAEIERRREMFEPLERTRPQPKRIEAMDDNTKAWADWVQSEINERLYASNDFVFREIGKFVGEELGKLDKIIGELQAQVGELRAAAHVERAAAEAEVISLPNWRTKDAA